MWALYLLISAAPIKVSSTLKGQEGLTTVLNTEQAQKNLIRISATDQSDLRA